MNNDVVLDEHELRSLLSSTTVRLNDFLYSGKPFLDVKEWEMFEVFSFAIYLSGNKIDKYKDIVNEYTKEFGNFQKCFVYKNSFFIGSRYELINLNSAREAVNKINMITRRTF